MPYTMTDYPSSLKSLEKIERRKAIDIINAMLEEGYEAGRAIPVGTEQAQEWYKNANEADIRKLEDKNITQHKSDPDAKGPELADNNVDVYFKEKEWKVKTKGADKPSDTFEYKRDAVARAEEIVENRNAEVNVHNRND
ncbi:DUF2188 domain-containing protein [Salinicoccus albus]|uniref:DUF2188 domain-containing protein n=1 Tax=Salinicoccus albus TaxID=418756 RepID=UPI000382770E|nr:DUF2188 domain-containing protein [Salinicoccus albus]